MESEQQQETISSSATTPTISVPATEEKPITTTNGVVVAADDIEETEQKMEKGDILKLALNHLVQGKRHLLVKDIGSAIASLGESCKLLAEVNGPLSADNAEAHFYYGKALLEQSRLDLSVGFGGGVAPEKEGEGESDEDSDEEEDEDEGEDEVAKEQEKDGEKSSSSGGKKETDTDDENDEEDDQANTIEQEKEPSSSSSLLAGSSINNKEQDDSKMEEDLSAESLTAIIPATSTSTSTLVQDNEQPSTSSGIGGGDNNADKEEGEEELSNLELAWEVLEIAKIGYNAQLKLALSQLEKSAGNDQELEKSKTKTKLHLQKRLSETHSLLGEVATESENYQQAVEDFKIAMQMLTEIEGEDSREVAQYYFQMGLAYSFAKEFELAIESFTKSKTIIELRILNLQTKIDNKQTVKDLGGGGELGQDDPNYSEDVEILELKSLLPELDEKVADTIDAERESKATDAEEVQEREIALKNSPVKNPNPPAANDISHLVKKKKKAEEPLEDSVEQPPSKRACTDSNNTIISKTDEVVTSTNGHNNSSSPSSSHENGQKNGSSPNKSMEV